MPGENTASIRPDIDGADAKVIAGMITRLENKLGTEHAENRGDLAEMRDSIAELRKAFPGDDPKGHRDFHDALIAESLARKAFWTAMWGKLIERGIWAMLAFLLGAVWFYLKGRP